MARTPRDAHRHRRPGTERSARPASAGTSRACCGSGRLVGAPAHTSARSTRPTAGIGAAAGSVGEVVRVPGEGGTRWEQGAAGRARPARPARRVLRAGLHGALLTSCRSSSSCTTCRLRRTRNGSAGARACGGELWRGGPHGARAVLTVSEFSRDEIVRHLGIPADRVHVIPHGRRHRRRAVACRASRWCSSSARSSIGATCPVLIGLRAARRDSPACGSSSSAPTGRIRGRTSSALARAAGIADRVGVRDCLDDDELRACISAPPCSRSSRSTRASASRRSRRWRRVPPVVLDTPVAREVYGDAAIRVAAPERDAGRRRPASALDEAGARDAPCWLPPRPCSRDSTGGTAAAHAGRARGGGRA